MRTDIDAGLDAQMASGDFVPVTRLYRQDHLPKWTTNNLAGTPDDNLFGHDVAHASGYFYRARSGSLASPTNGTLYFAKIADTTDPSLFDGSWVSTGITGVASPSPTSDPAGQVAIAVDGLNVSIFYFHGTPAAGACELRVVSSADGGSTWGSASAITTVDEDCLCVAAVSPTEIFFTDYALTFDGSARVTYGYGGSDIYSGVIGRASYSGSWTVDKDWPLKGHFIFRKSDRAACDILNADSAETTWGLPAWPGLGVAERSDGSYTITSGGIWRHAGRYDNHWQGNFVFTYDPDTDYWWHENTISLADFAEEALYWDVYSRCSSVNGNMVTVFQTDDEPIDVVQSSTAQTVARRSELVYSYSQDGVLWTEPHAIYSGDDTYEWGTGKMLHAQDQVWVITYYHVAVATATHVFDSNAPKTEISATIGSWAISQTGRTPDTQANINVLDIDNLGAMPGDLITIEAGAEVASVPTYELVGQGQIDTIDDAYAVENRQAGGQMKVLMGKSLLDVRARDPQDIMPQEYMIIEPDDLITQLMYEWGDWHVEHADSNFWSEHATVKTGLFSGPEAQTKFVEISTFDDKVHAGGWWHQLAFLTYPHTMNAEVTVKMRMGLKGKDVAFDTGTKNWPNSIYSSYTNGFGDRWGISGGAEADLDFCAGGIAFRGRDSYSTYVFAWEPGLRSWNLASQWGAGEGETCHADTSFGWIDKANNTVYAPYRQNAIKGSYLGSEVVTGSTIAAMGGDDRLVLYLFENANTGEDRNHHNTGQKRYLLASNSSHGLTRGYPVELKIVTYHGQIHCFYRDLISDAAWSLAFSYDGGVSLGAGRFGLYGRGYNGPEGSAAIPLAMRNRTWFWDMRMANSTKNITVEEVCERFAWNAGVETVTDDAIDSTPPVGLYDATALNPVIEASLTLSSATGFLVRATDANNGIRLSVTGGAVGTGKFSLDVIESGVSVKTLTAPTWFTISTGDAVLVRFSAHKHWYSVWIEDRLLGTIYYEYAEAGTGIGRYGSGTFHSVRMPELVEIPQFATLDANQTMMDAIRNFLGQRRIKRFITHEGKLRLSYFVDKDNAGAVTNTMIRSARRQNHQSLTHVRVVGGDGTAEYKSTSLPDGTRRFREVSLPDIEDHSIMWKEARQLVIESFELASQENFIGHPDLTRQPEDQLTITVTAQGISGTYVIDDITLFFQEHELLQEIGARSTYVE